METEKNNQKQQKKNKANKRTIKETQTATRRCNQKTSAEHNWQRHLGIKELFLSAIHQTT
jgi:hypothetical protein